MEGRGNDGSRIDGEGERLCILYLVKSCEKVRGYTRSSPTFSTLSYIPCLWNVSRFPRR